MDIRQIQALTTFPLSLFSWDNNLLSESKLIAYIMAQQAIDFQTGKGISNFLSQLQHICNNNIMEVCFLGLTTHNRMKVLVKPRQYCLPQNYWNRRNWLIIKHMHKLEQPMNLDQRSSDESTMLLFLLPCYFVCKFSVDYVTICSRMWWEVWRFFY